MQAVQSNHYGPAVSSPLAGAGEPTISQAVQAVLRATQNGAGALLPVPPALVSPRAGGPVVVLQGIGPSYSASRAGGFVAGTPLAALIDANSEGELDEEANCLATAVYFESKGEPIEGQLAVAQVVMNRAHSGRYPPTLCGVVKQHAQFSFVRGGAFPWHDASCAAWRKAQAIARIAQKQLVAALPADVLWYHADYVAPRWRAALIKVEQIGAHIFYRA